MSHDILFLEVTLMFITTAGRTNEEMINRAKEIAQRLNDDYIPRRKKSIPLLQKEYSQDCIVVGKERLEWFQMGAVQPFFFHPNSAMFRIRRLLKGDHDPFADVAKLSRGMSFLDCTLGLASDSIVASFLTGNEGIVTGIEGQKYLAYMVGEGLQSWDSGLTVMNDAMKRIQVIHNYSLDYLRTLQSNSFDCVYFDPMFEESILESDGIKTLGSLALYHDLNEEMISEALRVAKQRVIMKDHYKSHRFDKYGFHIYKRKTAKFHFGVLEK